MHEPRDRAYLRHQRKRIIQKRLRILKDIWRFYDSPLLEKPGRLAKYNLSCNCWLCKFEKKMGIEKPKYKARLGDMDEGCVYSPSFY